MKIYKKGILLIFIITFIIPINADELKLQWKLKKNKKGIKIYTRYKTGHDIKEYKGVAEIDASMKKIERVILDIPNHTNWMYQVVSSVVVRPHHSNPIQYNIINAPFVAKRDVIVQWHVVRKTNRILLNFKGIEHKSYPEKKGHVRIPLLEGKWELIKKGPNKTEVIYQNRADPGGKIPIWIINLTIVAMPYKTIISLKELVDDPKYE